MEGVVRFEAFAQQMTMNTTSALRFQKCFYIKMSGSSCLMTLCKKKFGRELRYYVFFQNNAQKGTNFHVSCILRIFDIVITSILI